MIFLGPIEQIGPLPGQVNICQRRSDGIEVAVLREEDCLIRVI